MSQVSKDFCIDIDNTIAQTDKVMRELIAEVTEQRVQLNHEDIVTFNYYECRDGRGNRISKEEWNEVHDRFSESENVMRIEPITDAVEGLRQIAEHGHVHLATSRLRKARAATVQWLDHHGFPDHDLHFLRHGE